MKQMLKLLHKHILIIIFLCVLVSPDSLAQINKPELEQSQNKTYQEHSKKDVFDLNIGFAYLSTVERRGATISEYPFILPGLDIALFKRKVVIRGPSLTYKHNFSKKLSITGTLDYFNDNVFITLFGNQSSLRRSRFDSLETGVSLQYKPFYFLAFDFSLYQDVIEHFGQYAEFKIITPFAVIKRQNKAPWAIFKLENSIGLGSGRHNAYLYGSKNKTGITNYKLGLVILSPQPFNNTFILTGFYYYTLTGSAYRNALLVSDKKSGFKGILVVAYELF